MYFLNDVGKNAEIILKKETLCIGSVKKEKKEINVFLWSS